MLVPEASYIVIGGTGGLGRNITSWLAEKGARHLIVISRSGGSNKTVGKMVKDLAANGATIVVCQCDISKKEEVEAKLVTVLPQMPPVRGVIYGAMVLRVCDSCQSLYIATKFKAANFHSGYIV